MRVRALLMLAVFVVLVGGCTDADDGPSGGSPEIDERSASSTTTEGTQTTAEPTCEETEAFASTLTDTGVNYDYSPTSSPAALGAKVDVVFGATLTGTLGQVRSADHQEYVSY